MLFPPSAWKPLKTINYPVAARAAVSQVAIGDVRNEILAEIRLCRTASLSGEKSKVRANAPSSCISFCKFFGSADLQTPLISARYSNAKMAAAKVAIAAQLRGRRLPF